MPLSTFAERRRLESLDRPALRQHQIARLNSLLEVVLAANAFYADKLAGVQLPISSVEHLADWPFTTKNELISDASNGDLAKNLTWPPQEYVRFHQTSGTRGRPMVVLDTPDDWRWFQEGWQYVLDAAEVTDRDRVLMAFSFGPFIGFWVAYHALVARGALVVPGGGMSSLARLNLIRVSRANVLCCTPSYALHLAEIGANQGISPAELGIERVIVAGEPGGSVPATQRRIEQLWHARVVDHSGATEVGAWGYGYPSGDGLHVNEAEFIAEFIAVGAEKPAGEGALAELVLTGLGRSGAPVIRYRTGDLVRPTWERQGANRFVFLTGGVLGRADDMMIVRGVNVFPSSIEQIVRGFDEVQEYRVTVHREAEMDRLAIEVEDRLGQPQRIAAELQLRLGLTVDVRAVPLGSLPRFEGKGKRLIDRRV